MTVQEKSPMLPCIQLIRFIAAIGVMMSHIGFGDSYLTGIVFSAGVNLFFCISAFLMMYTTQNNVQENFIKKRLIRLLPLYWTLTVLTFVASKIIDGLASSDIGFNELIKSLLCVPYYRSGLKTDLVIRPIVGPAWTMGYDVWFLPIFALSMKLSHKWRGAISSAMCVIIVLIGNIIPENPIGHFMGRHYWLNYVMGILVFYIWKWAEDKTEWRKKYFLLWSVISLTGFLFLYIGRKSLDISVLISFVTIVSVLFCFGKKQMPKWVLWFGKISFSFYLTHYYVILILGKFIDFEAINIMTCIGTVIAFVLSLATGYIGYYLFEEKIGNSLKKLLMKPKKNKSVVSV